TAMKSKARSATRSELEVLTDAVAEYFRDTGAFPSDLGELSVSPGVTGWSGPYIQAESVDPVSGNPESVVDAWSTPYAIAAVGSSGFKITSAGEDKTFGTVADISRTLDVTPIRREKTLTVLRTVNQAITQYNALYLPDSPLSTSYGTLLGQLVSTGFLPDTAPFAVDGWGDALVVDPPGLTPVVQVTSTHL
ncbi:MAG TPA: hypothetical protein ENJ09_06160, partial [Planctomycetes bacterium]|nr:hypothetical protein [Planctomycetota bacterium]